MNSTEARIRYLRWLSVADPNLLAAAAAKSGKQLGDYDTLEGWADTLVSAAVTVAGTVLAKKQADAQLALQRQQMKADAAAADAARQDALRVALLQTNTDRAARGLPPVDANGVVITSSQLPQLSASQLSPTYATSSGVPAWMWIAGAGALAFALLG